MDKEYMKSYLLKLHELEIPVLELYRICFMQYYYPKYLNNEITIDQTVEKLYHFISLTCGSEYLQAFAIDYGQACTCSEYYKRDFFESYMRPSSFVMRSAIESDNYKRLTMPHIEMQYKARRIERIQMLVDTFPEVAEFLINILRGEVNNG